MILKAGMRLRSVVCSGEVVVVRAPTGELDLRCGGRPMAEAGAAGTAVPIDPAQAAGTQLGKRYADDGTGLEVLCVKAGAGSLSLGSEPLQLKHAKPMPSSD